MSVKNQHFIPQVYLKHWNVNGAEQVYCYKKGNLSEAVPKNISKILCQSHTYTIGYDDCFFIDFLPEAKKDFSNQLERILREYSAVAYFDGKEIKDFYAAIDYLHLHRLFFRQRLSILIQNRLALFVQLFHLLFDLVGRRGKDFDAFFALFHGAVERVFPLVEARHQLSALHGDQQGVVEAVIVEFCHRGEVGFVAVAVEQLLNARFQPVCYLFHALCAVLAIQDNGKNLLRLRLTLDGRCDVCRIPQDFR